MMNMFSALWSGAKALFGGSSKAEQAASFAETAIKGVGHYIDGKDFTPQEQAEQWAKAVDVHLELVKATANENSLRSVTRRWLAWGITGFMVFWGSVGMGFAIAGKKEIVTNMVAVADAFNLGIAFVCVVGFYFGVQLLRK